MSAVVPQLLLSDKVNRTVCYKAGKNDVHITVMIAYANQRAVFVFFQISVPCIRAKKPEHMLFPKMKYFEYFFQFFGFFLFAHRVLFHFTVLPAIFAAESAFKSVPEF